LLFSISGGSVCPYPVSGAKRQMAAIAMARLAFFIPEPSLVKTPDFSI
jgi:hypothetical protein